MSDKDKTISQESTIDLELEGLAGKLVRGEDTDDDRYNYQQLSLKRSLLMRPPLPPRKLKSAG